MSEKVRTHKDLDVWKESIEIVKDMYKITSTYPKEEIYALTSQIRRCSISIPSNIAEGAARNSNKEFIQFLYIALGSCAEIDTQLIISKELGYITSGEYEKLSKSIEKIKSKILGLIRYVKGKT